MRIVQGNSFCTAIMKGRILLLALCLLVLPVSIGFCADTYDWNVPVLGVLKAPNGLQVAEVKDLQNTIDKYYNEEKAKRANSQNKVDDLFTQDGALERLHKAQIAAYQLMLNDGQSYRLAWMLVIQDGEDAGAYGKFFQKSSGFEQQLQMALAQQLLSTKVENLNFIDPKTNSGLKVIEFSKLEALPLANSQAYSLGVRMLAKSEEMNFPIYMRGHMMVLGSHLAGAALLTMDSERDFWDPIFKDMIAGL